MSALYQILPYQEQLMNRYTDYCLPELDKDIMTIRSSTEGFGSSVVFQAEKRFNRVNEFMNVVFSLNITLEGDYKSRLQRLNKYYEWIADIDGFNYDYFNPDWINQYVTKFYFRRFYKSRILKNKLEEFIKSEDSNNSQKVINSYTNIYIRKTWDKSD